MVHDTPLMGNIFTDKVTGELMRVSARRAITVRMHCLGISRRDLAVTLGISVSYLHRVIAGFGSVSTQTRKLIEVALDTPIWSTPEEFHALTRVIRRQFAQIPQTDQNQKTQP